MHLHIFTESGEQQPSAEIGGRVVASNRDIFAKSPCSVGYTWDLLRGGPFTFLNLFNSVRDHYILRVFRQQFLGRILLTIRMGW